MFRYEHCWSFVEFHRFDRPLVASTLCSTFAVQVDSPADGIEDGDSVVSLTDKGLKKNMKNWISKGEKAVRGWEGLIKRAKKTSKLSPRGKKCYEKLAERNPSTSQSNSNSMFTCLPCLACMGDSLCWGEL